MLSIINKSLLIFFKLIISLPLLVWSLFTKNHESEVYEFMKDSGLDSLFDFMSGGFMFVIGFINMSGMHIDIHSVFEAIFFYTSGSSATIWALFRLKLAYLDHKIKSKQLKDLEKDNEMKDLMIKDLKENKGKPIDYQKYLKDK